MERYESRSKTLTVNVQKHAWAKKVNYFFLSWTFSNIFLIFYTIYNLRYFLSIIKYGHKALINFQKKIEIGFCWNIFPCILDPLIILTDPHNWILPQVFNLIQVTVPEYYHHLVCRAVRVCSWCSSCPGCGSVSPSGPAVASAAPRPNHSIWWPPWCHVTIFQSGSAGPSSPS